jgi:ABC-type enterobactin transport system permease subunit
VVSSKTTSSTASGVPVETETTVELSSSVRMKAVAVGFAGNISFQRLFSFGI